MRNDELMHYGVKGMKWGVCKDPRANSPAYNQSKKQWTREPEGGSIRRQVAVLKAKTPKEKYTAKKQLKQGYKEYSAFMKDMHKTHGARKNYKYNQTTKKYEHTKTGKQIEKWEYTGIENYDTAKKIKLIKAKDKIKRGSDAVVPVLAMYGSYRYLKYITK